MRRSELGQPTDGAAVRYECSKCRPTWAVMPANTIFFSATPGYRSAQESAELGAQPTWMLLDAVATLEEYVLYATERKWWGEIPDIELTVSAIKSELGRRGAFE